MMSFFKRILYWGSDVDVDDNGKEFPKFNGSHADTIRHYAKHNVARRFTANGPMEKFPE